MLYKAVEQLCIGTVSSISSYTSSNWVLGPNIRMYKKDPVVSLNPSTNFIGPNVTSRIAMAEQSTALSGVVSCGITWSSTIDWIFVLEAVATQTKRINLYTYDRSVGLYRNRGFVTFTRPFAPITAASNRGLASAYYTHTTGTVEVTGVTVSGTGTLFSTQRISVGARIGFGTQDPTIVNTWYYIRTINSDTSITLTYNVVSSLSANTNYVIEELRLILSDTMITLNSPQSGVFIMKGLNFDDFSIAGTTIPGAVGTSDNQKACYQLTDSYRTGGTSSLAGTVSNWVPQCAVLDNPRRTNFDGLTHSLYVIDGTSNYRLYVYNTRANDPITSGLMALTGSNIMITGAVTLGSLNLSNTIGNVACIATTKHGPGAGIKSLYFCTQTRIHRADLTTIYHGKPNWVQNSRTDIPPGSSTTMAVFNTFFAISYDEESDRFILQTNSLVTTTFVRQYYTRFGEQSTDPFEHAIGYNLLLLDGSTSDPRSIPIVSNYIHPAAGNLHWIAQNPLSGLTHMVKWGANTIGISNIFAIPYAAHWEYANDTGEVAISPAITISDVDEFVRLSISDLTHMGEDPYTTVINRLRAYCRTSGIDDNTGGWEPLDDSGDLSSIKPSKQIQFKFEFQLLGSNFNIPPRFFGFNVVYKEISTDYHYQLSSANTDEQTKRFVWRFAKPFGGTVSTLRVRLYDNYTNNLLVDDNTSNPMGTFQRSTNGGISWATYSSQDKSNETTYIRYKPSSLSDTVDVRPILTLL